MGEGLSDVLGLARPHGAGMMQQVSAGLHGVQDGVQKFFRRLSTRLRATVGGGAARGGAKKGGKEFREDAGMSELHFGGTLLFGVLVWLVSALPGALPLFYLVYCAVALPMRAVKYVRIKWGFFLFDFCYLVNAVCIVHLAFFPREPRLAAFAHMLADGPVAGAIIVWRTSWVFSSPEHVISVMIHMLPGLALMANRMAGGPKGLWEATVSLRQLAGSILAGAPLAGLKDFLSQFSSPPPPETWHLTATDAFLWKAAAPIAFYVAWQVAYWFVVQVALIDLFRKNKAYQTSFKWLTARKNSWVIRQVNRGKPRRRIVMFGLVQFTYTLFAYALVYPLYPSFYRLAGWQAIKAGFALWYGAQYQCEAIPKKIHRRALAGYDRVMADIGTQELNSMATSVSPVVEAAVLDAAFVHPGETDGWFDADEVVGGEDVKTE